MPGPSRGAKLAPAAPGRGRAAASVQCARAAAGVCPRFPLPSRRSLGQAQRRADTEAPALGAAPRPAQPGRRALGGRGRTSSGAPRLGRGSRRRARPSRSEARGERAAPWLRGSGRLQAPPAGAQALPLFSPPPRSIPHAPQGSQTRWPRPRRRSRSMRMDPALGLAAGARDPEQGPRGPLDLAGSSKAPELARSFPAVFKTLRPG